MDRVTDTLRKMDPGFAPPRHDLDAMCTLVEQIDLGCRYSRSSDTGCRARFVARLR
jgi:hypothetical protein